MRRSIFLLGVDGGGTSCRARLTDAAGRVLGHGHSGPASLRLGVDAAWASLTAAATAAIAEAGIELSACDIHVAMGVAGIERAGARDALLAKPNAFASLEVDSDAAIACVGAHGAKDGGIIVVGTGSIGFGYVDGRQVRCGGYGFPASDKGSGASIGLGAVAAALRAHDKRIIVTPLLAELLERFESNPAKLVDWMDAVSATDYATLAPLVVSHAALGDIVGRGLMVEAGAAIGELAQGLVDDGVRRICLMGGLAAAIEPWLPQETRASLVLPAGDALDGALLLAQRGSSRRRGMS